MTFSFLFIETNAAEHYERTKLDLYKDDICFNLNLRSYGQLFFLVFYAYGLAIYTHIHYLFISIYTFK